MLAKPSAVWQGRQTSRLLLLFFGLVRATPMPFLFNHIRATKILTIIGKSNSEGNCSNHEQGKNKASISNHKLMAAGTGRNYPIILVERARNRKTERNYSSHGENRDQKPKKNTRIILYSLGVSTGRALSGLFCLTAASGMKP